MSSVQDSLLSDLGSTGTDPRPSRSHCSTECTAECTRVFSFVVLRVGLCQVLGIDLASDSVNDGTGIHDQVRETVKFSALYGGQNVPFFEDKNRSST
jgi:hypothetical protein